MSELARPVGIALRDTEWNNWNHVLDQLSKPKPRMFEACVDSFKNGKTVVPCAELDDLLLNVIGFPENDGCAYLVYLTPGHQECRSLMTMLQHASSPKFMFFNETVYRASSNKILALAHSDAFDAQRKRDQDFLDSKTPEQLKKLQKRNKRSSDLTDVVAQNKKLKRCESRRNSNASSDDAEDADESTLDLGVDALDPEIQASASGSNNDDIDGSEMDVASDNMTPLTALDSTTSVFDRNTLIDSILNQGGTTSSLSAHNIVTAALMAVPEDQQHAAADQLQQEITRLLVGLTPDDA